MPSVVEAEAGAPAASEAASRPMVTDPTLTVPPVIASRLSEPAPLLLDIARRPVAERVPAVTLIAAPVSFVSEATYTPAPLMLSVPPASVNAPEGVARDPIPLVAASVSAPLLRVVVPV